MKRYDTIKLIGATPAQKGVFDQFTPSEREVFCEIRSVNRNELYQARAIGLDPTFVFALAIAEDYQGEKELIYNGVQYSVIRTYVMEDGIEITAEVSKRGQADNGS